MRLRDLAAALSNSHIFSIVLPGLPHQNPVFDINPKSHVISAQPSGSSYSPTNRVCRRTQILRAEVIFYEFIQCPDCHRIFVGRNISYISHSPSYLCHKYKECLR